MKNPNKLVQKHMRNIFNYSLNTDVMKYSKNTFNAIIYDEIQLSVSISSGLLDWDLKNQYGGQVLRTYMNNYKFKG